ncbi:hypothetical protein [Mesorhizobium sp. L-8-10]|uniref:hypothetical protein n=1 Tax=Mesorhizobium sp. L-8-10 TaxID=2744523 RepID=UPI00192770B1|nr:hypothetical protein [Mesorhizobium sp. L-8-10]
MSQADVLWLAAGFITKITHHWRMTGVDTSEDWIELHRGKSDGTKERRRFPSSFLNTNGYFEFRPNWRQLVTPTYRGENAIKDLEAIDAWEKKHARQRAEYERLKKKFDG